MQKLIFENVVRWEINTSSTCRSFLTVFLFKTYPFHLSASGLKLQFWSFSLTLKIVAQVQHFFFYLFIFF